MQIEDITEQLAALALQGPTSGKLLKSVAEADIENLKYFRKTSGKIAGVDVDISRTGYTGDLGYEIWIPWQDAVKVWDALMDVGRGFDIHPTGMLALDVARIEAGLILADVDYVSSKKALIAAQKYTPSEIGLGKLVHLDKDNFIGKQALLEEKKRGPERVLVGLEIDWNEFEALCDARRTAAANSRHRLAGSCAGLSGTRSGGQGDLDHVVSAAQAIDRAGERRAPSAQPGHQAADRDDGGSGASSGDRDGPAVAVLQPAAQDEDAGLEAAAISRTICAHADRQEAVASPAHDRIVQKLRKKQNRRERRRTFHDS